MKIIIIICCALVSLLKLNAQEIDTKLLIKKWKVDVELMRPVIAQMLSERPDMTGLNEINKKVAIQTALDQIAFNTIEYKQDGTRESVTSKGKTTEKWKYNEVTNTIIVETEKNKEKIFNIIKLEADKLHLRTEDNKDLFLK